MNKSVGLLFRNQTKKLIKANQSLLGMGLKSVLFWLQRLSKPDLTGHYIIGFY